MKEKLLGGLFPVDRRFAFRNCSRLSLSVPVEIDLSPIGIQATFRLSDLSRRLIWICPSADPRGQVKNMFDRSIGSLVLLVPFQFFQSPEGKTESRPDP